MHECFKCTTRRERIQNNKLLWAPKTAKVMNSWSVQIEHLKILNSARKTTTIKRFIILTLSSLYHALSVTCPNKRLSLAGWYYYTHDPRFKACPFFGFPVWDLLLYLKQCSRIIKKVFCSVLRVGGAVLGLWWLFSSARRCDRYEGRVQIGIACNNPETPAQTKSVHLVTHHKVRVHIIIE